MIKLLLLTLLALTAVAAWAWSSHYRAKKQLAQEKENARLAAEVKAQEDARLKAEAEVKRLAEMKTKAKAESEARLAAEAEQLAEERRQAEEKARAEAEVREKARLTAEAEAQQLAKQKAKTEETPSQPAEETKPRQERVPVKPEDRGGRSRETAPKNQVESKRKRRARTPKPEIVCWKREREWILAVELPEDFSENQNVTVVQDGKPLDEDDTEDGCWRLSQLHGEVVVRVLDAEIENLFKLPIGDAGCLVFKLSGGDRNRGRHVKRPGSGSCLVIVPKDWERDEALAGAPPYEPEDVCLLGYRAHFFEL